jgi:hypothetical protein
MIDLNEHDLNKLLIMIRIDYIKLKNCSYALVFLVIFHVLSSCSIVFKYCVMDWFIIIDYFICTMRNSRLSMVDNIFLNWCLWWDWGNLDTSLFLRIVASPETLNGQDRWKPCLECFLCVLEVLTMQDRLGG